MIVALVGWAATLAGTLLGLPQLVKLARTRSVEGLSLLGWQAGLVVNLSWLAHGLRIHQAPQATVSAFSLIATVPIVVLLARELGRSVARTLLPSLAAAVALVGVDEFFGSAVFGTAALIPGILSVAGPSLELVRSRDVRGVSAQWLVLAFLNQTLWSVWALLVHDAGSMIAILISYVVIAFNLVWYVARRLGVPAFFAPREVGLAVPETGELPESVEV